MKQESNSVTRFFLGALCAVVTRHMGFSKAVFHGVNEILCSLVAGLRR